MTKWRIRGQVLNSTYNITNAAWRTFRLETFEKFRLTFNTGNSGTQIGLLFNNIDPVSEPTEWQWVSNNITYGFGTKGGAYARGHHLSDELDFRTTWTPYLVNPQGLKLFSAAEMDQTWTKPYYQLNVPIGFYWGALSGLNTGLSVWLVTQSALQEAQTRPILHDVFKMFNKYAPQAYPSAATAAYSIFHEGLNSQNTTKFPVSIYGSANQSNQARYLAICSAYTSRGAQMDDVFAATKGQVYQRDSQTGYNDAGWNIQEGNYERWITQIKPDSTSIGLFRVRGALNTSSSIYDRFARSFQNSSGKNTMYFKFDANVFALANPDSLVFKMIWLDKTPNSTWALKYYNASGLQTALTVTGIGDNQWKTVYVTLHNPLINQGGTLGSDFMLVNTDAIDDIFHGIEVDITRQSSPLPVTLLSFTGKYNASRNANDLDWTTASERNNDYFEVMKSNDAKTFSAIGRVESTHNATEPKSYDFKDYNPNLVNYYYLKQVDYDGKTTNSNIIAIHSNNKVPSILLFPNPTFSVVFWDKNVLVDEVIVTNLSGQTVLNLHNPENNSLNLSNLPKGVYWLEFLVEKKRISVEKIVKE